MTEEKKTTEAYECVKCKMSFETNRGFRSHQRQKHGDNPSYLGRVSLKGKISFIEDSLIEGLDLAHLERLTILLNLNEICKRAGIKPYSIQDVRQMIQNDSMLRKARKTKVRAE